MRRYVVNLIRSASLSFFNLMELILPWIVQNQDKKAVNQACSPTVLCNGDAGLSCQLGICKCDSSSFFDGNKCATLKEHAESCTESSECDESQGLVCQSGSCECSESMTFDGETCSRSFPVLHTTWVEIMTHKFVGSFQKSLLKASHQPANRATSVIAKPVWNVLLRSALVHPPCSSADSHAVNFLPKQNSSF